MSIQGLIFDFDGLILETEEPIFISWQELYRDYGCQLTLDVWQAIIGTSNADALFDPAKELDRLIGRNLNWAELEPVRRKRELDVVYSLAPLPGVLEMLDDARQMGLKIAIASSSPCSWVTGHLERLALMDYFDCIVAEDDVSHTKPDPELFLKALDCLGLDASQAVVFEDSLNGVLAAKRAGLYVVAVPTVMTRNLALDQADLRLSSLAQVRLVELLERIELGEWVSGPAGGR